MYNEQYFIRRMVHRMILIQMKYQPVDEGIKHTHCTYTRYMNDQLARLTYLIGYEIELWKEESKMVWCKMK